jgi:hypothetical protein
MPVFSQILVQDESVVFTRWLQQANLYGAAAKGGIFASDFKGCDAYLRVAEQVLPPGTVRERGQGSWARWTLPNTATITLDRIPNMYHAYAQAGRDYSLMAYHRPDEWFEKSPMEYMLNLLRSVAGVPIELITVHTPLVSDLVCPPADAAPAKPSIDYSAITRSVL